MLVELAQTLGPAEQAYLLEARQMQALSFAVHIPLVCFGVAFPVLVLGSSGWTGAAAIRCYSRSRAAGRRR